MDIAVSSTWTRAGITKYCLYPPKANPLDTEKVEKLDAAMAGLSEREREVFELVVGQRFSLAEAGRLLKILKSTVQSYLQRAKNKIVS